MAGLLQPPILRPHIITLPRLDRPASGQMKSDGAPALEVAGGDDLDRTLIAAIAAGNEAAFNAIYARYHARIARFARRITRSSELTAEITNDTLWTIWRCAANFKGASRVSTWILGIGYHISRKTLQRNRRRAAHEGPMQDFIEAAREPCSDGDADDCVDAALIQLSEEQRTALDLFYRFGYSCEEISQSLNCPRNTVKTRLFHGRRKLRRLLPRPAARRQTSKQQKG